LVLADEIAGCLSNADGLRVGKETPSESRKFIYDFRKLLQETDGADDPQRWYTFTTEEYGDLVRQYDGSDTLYHQCDGLGSTDALLDEWETATDRYAHRAFGLEAARSGTTDNAFTYVGRQSYYKDPELELYLLGARYYDPQAGRFLSQDPIGFDAGDANVYRYVENSPTNATDPSGLHAIWRAPWRDIPVVTGPRELPEPSVDLSPPPPVHRRAPWCDTPVVTEPQHRPYPRADLSPPAPNLPIWIDPYHPWITQERLQAEALWLRRGQALSQESGLVFGFRARCTATKSRELRRGQTRHSGFAAHARSIAATLLASSWLDSARRFCANHDHPSDCRRRDGVSRRCRGAVG
jgi:RHS repeat-associated protein